MNDDEKLTDHATNEQPMQRKASAPLGIDAWAEWERHFQETDALIAERLHLRLSHVQRQRETRFVYWEYLERKAKAVPPVFDASAFAPGEFLRWSERHPNPAGCRWDCLIWGGIILAGCAFFGERIPGAHEAVTAFFKELLP